MVVVTSLKSLVESTTPISQEYLKNGLKLFFDYLFKYHWHFYYILLFISLLSVFYNYKNLKIKSYFLWYLFVEICSKNFLSKNFYKINDYLLTYLINSLMHKQLFKINQQQSADIDDHSTTKNNYSISNNSDSFSSDNFSDNEEGKIIENNNAFKHFFFICFIIWAILIFLLIIFIFHYFLIKNKKKKKNINAVKNLKNTI